MTSKFYTFLFATFFLIRGTAYCQDHGLTDGRAGFALCQQCYTILNNMPKEVLFGIHFDDDQVYFQMTSEEWFNRIFVQNTDGITADIVTKDQFSCTNTNPSKEVMPRGKLLKPVFLPELRKRLQKLPDGSVRISLGTVPPEMADKEKEGNFVIVRANKICYYLAFTNLERSLWQLLNMGLYADTLYDSENIGGQGDFFEKKFYFNRKATVTISFPKGAATYTQQDIKPLFDSLNLAGYTVNRITIRAFSSVEGDDIVNERLQKQRAESIVKAIETFQKKKIPTEISTGENWLEFMQELSKQKDTVLKGKSKLEIKQRLKTDKQMAALMEPALQKQRKAVITIYMDPKNAIENISNQDIGRQFADAIRRKDLKRAAGIQKAIFERIRDNQLPQHYLDEIEIPMEKYYSNLLMSREMYKHLLNETFEAQAVESLKELEALDPSNGKIKYNIYALQMRLWQYDDSLVERSAFLEKIKKLKDFGIPQPLIRRMLLNYKIILCELLYKAGDYNAKDRVLAEVKQEFLDKDFSDLDLLSLGKYLCWYGQIHWADELIRPRMDKLDVDEDLLFFYINLSIFTVGDLRRETYQNMLLNAISIDNDRFCAFFNSIDRGGISMQLLLDPFWKQLYCNNCSGIGIRKGTTP